MKMNIDLARGGAVGLIGGYLLGSFGITAIVLAAAGCYVLWVLFVKNNDRRN
jgi:uncharacterized iron-regulated membrane protein